MAGAGQDHGHSHDPVTQGRAEEIGAKSVARLVESDKLDKSWQAASFMKAEKKDFAGRMEWVIAFKNEKIDDPAKQMLYVFLTLGGDYLAAITPEIDSSVSRR